MRKLKERCGAALLEVLVSIAILGLLALPISSGIMVSLRINEQCNEMMKARLAVSSAAEIIMATGISSAEEAASLDLPRVDVENAVPKGGYWTLTVRSEDFEDIFVDIRIRSNVLRTPEGGGS